VSQIASRMLAPHTKNAVEQRETVSIALREVSHPGSGDWRRCFSRRIPALGPHGGRFTSF
jgi:hypothetical protein